MTLILPSPQIQVYIRSVNHEDVNTRDSDLQKIKKWLKKQPHLPDTWDDQCIMFFLRGCGFSMEKCKSKLDRYFTLRADIPEFFDNRDITRLEMQEFLELLSFGVMPHLTHDGKRITIAGANKSDFETPDIAHLFKLTLMIVDIRLQVEEMGVAGDIYIFDGSVVIFKHFIKVNPTLVKKFFICVLEAYPVKVKAVHVINATPFINFVIKWLAPFIKEKIRRRIHIHQNLESLHDVVSKDVLPEEYGGTAGNLNDIKEQWMKKLEEFLPWFKEQESVKVDESKRPGKPTNHEGRFGVDGSFRQLSID